jgi:hypothetical protein
MTKKLQEKFIHCMTRSKMNQNSNHISIFTKLMIIVKRNESRCRKTWKNMSIDKFLNNWRELVTSSSFNCVAQVEVYVLKIQQCVLRSIKIFVSWTNFFLRSSSFEMKNALKQWRWRNVDEENEFRCTSRKLDEIICERRMKRNESSQKKKIEFKQIFRTICDSSSSF